MNIKLSASLLAVFATAELSQAQHKPVLGHRNDPGLDPKVAATLPRQGAAKWSCTELPGRGFTDSSIIWPDGIVYYEFDANMPAEQIQIAKQGMDIWMFRGPAPNVRFLQHTPGDTSHPWTRISFITSGSNNAEVGVQFPSPGAVHQRDYADAYTMAHELGHTLGFYHEQGRPDRNTYITVLWSHIESGAASNFDVHPSIDWPAAALSTPYDFDSIMHYPPTWFSTCSNPHCDQISSCATFAVNPPYTSWQCEMEDHDHLSVNDVQDMINVYGQRTTPIHYVDPLSAGSTALGTIANPFPLLLMVPPSTALQDVYLSAGAHDVPNGTRLATKGRYAPHGGTATIH